MFFFLMIIIVFLVYLTSRKIKIKEEVTSQKCGKNKIFNIKKQCVCDFKNGFLPMIGGFGVSQQICYKCDPSDIVKVNGALACNYKGFGYMREANEYLNPQPATERDQCGEGFVLKDSKCQPAKSESKEDEEQEKAVDETSQND